MKRKLSQDSMLKRIVKIAFDEIDYFKENPKHLGWLMAQFQVITYCGNNASNPKYFILDYEGVTDEDMNFVYSAWSNSVCYGNPHCKDPYNNLYFKENMTMDEIIEMMLNKEYRYYGLYKKRYIIVDRLLMAIGTGMDWHNGYITEIANEHPEWMFVGYTVCEKEIKEKITNKVQDIISSNNDVKERFDKEWGIIHSFNKMSSKEQRITELKIFGNFQAENSLEEIEKDPKETTPIYYPWSEEYSNIANIPANAHDSFVKEAIVVLKQIINNECLFMQGGSDNSEPNQTDIDLANKILDKLRVSHPHMMEEEYAN